MPRWYGRSESSAQKYVNGTVRKQRTEKASMEARKDLDEGFRPGYRKAEQVKSFCRTFLKNLVSVFPKRPTATCKSFSEARRQGRRNNLLQRFRCPSCVGGSAEQNEMSLQTLSTVPHMKFQNTNKSMYGSQESRKERDQ